MDTLSMLQNPIMVFLSHTIGILPTWGTVTILIVFLIIFLVISIYGKASFKFGKTQIGLGLGIKNRKRSCGDCVILIMDKRETFELEKTKLTNNVLRDQMNFFEQKQIELQTLLLKEFSDKLKDYDVEKVKDYRLFQGLILDVFRIIKDEVRRSFKENGFVTFTDVEFEQYLNIKIQTVISTLEQHFLNLYPNSDVLIQLNDVMNIINKNYRVISESTISVFKLAKEIQKEFKENIQTAKNKFKKELDAIVVTK